MTAAAAYETLRINAARLNDTIHSTCEYGAALRYGPGAKETGMARLALDDNDALVRHWFAREMTALGCTVTVDKMGNQFALRPGRKQGPPTAIGSHLDTQPTGGRYDGVLGVISGVEAMRTLHENDYQSQYPLAVINWTNEEGARFPKSVVSSGVWAGIIPLEDAWGIKDVKEPSLSIHSELVRIGFLGDVECSHEATPLAAHFELHIEQGPILERERKTVGVVLGAQAYRWYTVDVKGVAVHTGSTPFDARSDALFCAAQCIVASNKIAKTFHGLASTGIMTVSPGSTNVCPGHVRFSLDVRNSSTSVLDDCCKAILAEMDRIAADDCEKGCTISFTLDIDCPAATFHPDAIAAVRESAIAEVGEAQVHNIYSGAGHDSCAVSTRVPTAMVFVPSKDGISHNPVEYTSPEECATGAQVLMQAALRYDSSRTS